MIRNAILIFIILLIIGSATSVSAVKMIDNNQRRASEFKELDINNDSKLDMDEFEKLVPTLMSDSFWDGYSEVSVLIYEFERIDKDHDGFIVFEEYRWM